MVRKITIKNLLRSYWRKGLVTWILVVVEAILMVSIPIVIGWGVDDLLNGSYDGLTKLAILLGSLLIVGASRRFYDTRAYSEIYREVSENLYNNEVNKGSSTSKISARVNLFNEFIQFLENSIPGIMDQFISLFGTLIIIYFINFYVFLVCIGVLIFTMIIYKLSESRIYDINFETNDQLEREVDLFSKRDRGDVKKHFSILANLRIKSSDLDTVNFSLVWIGLSLLLLYTIYEITSSGNSSFGEIVSAVMYVFGLVESLIAFPIYYMEIIRLGEITKRFEG